MSNKRLVKIMALLTERPKDAFLLFALGQEHYRNGEVDLAQQQFEQLKAEQPNYVGTYYHLGKCYEEQGLIDKAIAVYEAGIVVAKAAQDQHSAQELQAALHLLTL